MRTRMTSMVQALCLALLLPSPGSAQTTDEILAKAQSAFHDGVEAKDRLLQSRRQFSLTIDAYLELHHRGVRSPSLYANLGNAAALADRWPEAIWAYHVGLRLNPNDRAMREHLTFARAKVLYPASGQGRLSADNWPTWLHRPTVVELSWTFAMSYALAWLCGSVAFVTRKSRLIVLTCILMLLAICSGFGVAFEQSAGPALVVIAENTPFYRGNGPSYPQHAAVPNLPRGLEARIVHRRGDWLQLRLSTGEIGWLPRAQALIVEP